MSEDSNQKNEEEKKESESKKSSSSRKMLFIGLAFILLIGGGGGGFYYFKMMGKEHESEKKSEKDEKVVFLDLPELTVKLASKPGQDKSKNTYLQMAVTLEITSAEMLPDIQQLQPRLLDVFQVFLRELTPEDIAGSAGLYRLKEEMLTRINIAVFPAKVNAVLFKDVLVQ